MNSNSPIEWTTSTWNPVRGCSCISPGCAQCYAMGIAARFSRSGLPFEGFAVMTPNGPRWTERIALIGSLLEEPLRWKRPRLIFVNSMSDLFHEDLPEQDIQCVFDVMNRAHWHTYQILTKRSARLRELGPWLPWAPHIWMGVSVENADVMYRIDDLRRSAAHIKFLSIEPLLEPMPTLNLIGIDWVILGGESGRNARPMHVSWARGIRDQCVDAGIPFFFKQWGRLANNPDPTDPTAKENGGSAKGGRLLDGRTWDDMPHRITAVSGGAPPRQQGAGVVVALPVVE